MALAVFNQFPQLTRFFAQLARVAARKECVREFNRLEATELEAALAPTNAPAIQQTSEEWCHVERQVRHAVFLFEILRVKDVRRVQA